MRSHPCSALFAFALSLVVAAPCAHAGPVLPPDSTDFGDAPEGINAYVDGFPGHFPSCLAPGAPGTQELSCAPRSTPPGPTGYMKHLWTSPGYSLGCGPSQNSLAIDFEADAKVSSPGGPSACGGGPVDCVTNAFFSGPSFGQDECKEDLTDAGVPQFQTIVLVPPCSQFSFPINAYNAGGTRPVYLNILLDLNHDGDWNDNFLCNGNCAHEWEVKNLAVALPPGCSVVHFPPLLLPTPPAIPFTGTWLRISLTDDPVDDDYPWNGSAARPNGAYAGGETEDYPLEFIEGDAAKPTSWGTLKAIYR